MKPILTWYDQLPEPIRSQAIENYDKNKGVYFIPQDDVSFLHHALIDGFSWRKSPEGYGYWKEVYTKAISGEFDIKK